MSLMRAALALLAVLMLAPLVNLAFVVPPGALAAALGAPGTAAAFEISLAASLASVALGALLGVPGGYALARSASGVRTAVLLVLAVPLAMPPIASGIALLGLVAVRMPLGAWLDAHGLRVIDSLAGVALAEFGVSGSMIAIAATAAFAEIDPVLEEAARTLGAGPARIARTVALPLAAPGISAGIMLAWLRGIGEYGATSIVAYHPTSLPIALSISLSADGLGAALALTEAFALFTLAAVAIAALLRRRFT